ncbi:MULTISPECIES: class I SAM-dependent methyltransferase [Micromonospora]|uniref:Cyclopropane-fatty-acyl-phospholipid synthase n=1 Tax=Micromonospora yangpuensis TaxID=683228 RepID=A0A1C6U7U0_9ACTN|nr:class I SAM-dependent methyltransferase [Micromonospora yangpuensis]GGL89712.1 putative cyclopropane-fatty-acyl-phospholipid synthase [Micromonospora yangpuensis]SCL50165.1 cyclopropane-fatty-acyl-phospholipid synthase [Micromonospora yangpuensis]
MSLTEKHRTPADRADPAGRPPGRRTRTTVADVVRASTVGDLPVRITGYDGSALGPADSGYTLAIRSERGLSYLLTAPGDLGLARAYVSGDLALLGVHPGDPYPALRLLADELRLRTPGLVEALALVRGLGWERLLPPVPPPQEAPPRWRRVLGGLRHSRSRDSSVISHHYDVSNAFYERVLGPSMTYTCAVFGSPDDTLEQAQWAKYELVAGKLALRPGMRLLDVGCGWGGMVRHAAREHGVRALGVTLSREQARWAQAAIEKEGLTGLAEVRHLDYRDAPPGRFDAISSIGLTEHIGVRNYPAYFAALRDRLSPHGRLLNHCITRPDNRAAHRSGAFIDRYVFPDGELAGPGRLIGELHDVGLEVQHAENLRRHYALTLARWCANLAANWDACVAEVGTGTARVWGLYMAGARFSFERNGVQLHQVLATPVDPTGERPFPLRPDWTP